LRYRKGVLSRAYNAYPLGYLIRILAEARNKDCSRKREHSKHHVHYFVLPGAMHHPANPSRATVVRKIRSGAKIRQTYPANNDPNDIAKEFGRRCSPNYSID